MLAKAVMFVVKMDALLESLGSVDPAKMANQEDVVTILTYTQMMARQVVYFTVEHSLVGDIRHIIHIAI